MNIGEAVQVLKEGKLVAREGWNGKGMYLIYYAADRWKQGEFEYSNFEQLPFIAMKTADNKIVPWLCSQTDLLAEDWGVVT